MGSDCRIPQSGWTVSLSRRSHPARAPAATKRTHAVGPYWRSELPGWRWPSARCCLAGGRSGPAGRSFAEATSWSTAGLFAPAANDNGRAVECGLFRHGPDCGETSSALSPARATGDEGADVCGTAELPGWTVCALSWLCDCAAAPRHCEGLHLYLHGR